MMAPSIEAIDLNFLGAPHAIAAYLVRGPGGAVLIETGPGSTLPALLAGLTAHGLAPADVSDVLLTHIHLDHAGAAGWWARQGATLHVHHLGGPHLIEPDRLLASAQRIYGDQMGPLWGEFLSAPADKVRALQDGDVVEAGGLRFVAHDTPGHARHHMAYQLDEAAFTGDVTGVRRPDSPHLRIPTPPPEFDLEAWLASLARLRGLGLGRLYLTHYGPVDDAAAHLDSVAGLVPQYARLVRAGLEAGRDRDSIVAEYDAWEVERFDFSRIPPADRPVYTSLCPAGMAVDGLLRYWQKHSARRG
jgi:glyoxylase-like metal-dependent hydrolase (beta-lactamase superfamily II)